MVADIITHIHPHHHKKASYDPDCTYTTWMEYEKKFQIKDWLCSVMLDIASFH